MAEPRAADGPRRRRFRLGRRPRFTAAALLFGVLLVALLAAGMGVRAVLVAFVVAASVFLVAAAHMAARSDYDTIRTRAREEEPGRQAILWSGVAVSVVVLAALGLELHGGRSAGVGEIALAGASLLLSWLFMNALFALHYAHAYYGDDESCQPRGGLAFPGEKRPDYWDFAYFAIVIGMTFQVSDVQVADRRLRRIVLAHGLLAFLFNVVIVAISVNIVAGRV
jgi:uncharacterized membrane protein